MFQKILEFARGPFVDAALALLIGLVAAHNIASLAAAGVITMTLAVWLLVFAWVVAVAGSFLGPRPFPHTHRAIFAVVFALLLGGTGWYEAEKPASAKEMQEGFAKIIAAIPAPESIAALFGPDPLQDIPKPPVADAAATNQPGTSTLGSMRVVLGGSVPGNIVYMCDVPPFPKPDGESLNQSFDDYSKSLNRLGTALNANLSADKIDRGLRIDIDATDPINPFNKMAVEMRRFGQLVVVNVKTPSIPSLDLLPVTPDSKSMDQVSSMVQRILGVPDRACRRL